MLFINYRKSFKVFSVEDQIITVKSNPALSKSTAGLEVMNGRMVPLCGRYCLP